MQGYTIRVAEAISNADGNLAGVRLGRLCLQHDVSVSKVANYIGVTRQTVYSWFTGKSQPQAEHETAVKELVAKLAQTDV